MKNGLFALRGAQIGQKGQFAYVLTRQSDNTACNDSTSRKKSQLSKYPS
jgi:hypothetical protein